MCSGMLSGREEVGENPAEEDEDDDDDDDVDIGMEEKDGCVAAGMEDGGDDAVSSFLRIAAR